MSLQTEIRNVIKLEMRLIMRTNSWVAITKLKETMAS